MTIFFYKRKDILTIKQTKNLVYSTHNCLFPSLNKWSESEAYVNLRLLIIWNKILFLDLTTFWDLTLPGPEEWVLLKIRRRSELISFPVAKLRFAKGSNAFCIWAPRKIWRFRLWSKLYYEWFSTVYGILKAKWVIKGRISSWINKYCKVNKVSAKFEVAIFFTFIVLFPPTKTLILNLQVMFTMSCNV